MSSITRNILLTLLTSTLLIACSDFITPETVSSIVTQDVDAMRTFQRNCLSKPNRSLTISYRYRNVFDKTNSVAYEYHAKCYEGTPLLSSTKE